MEGNVNVRQLRRTDYVWKFPKTTDFFHNARGVQPGVCFQSSDVFCDLEYNLEWCVRLTGPMCQNGLNVSLNLLSPPATGVWVLYEIRLETLSGSLLSSTRAAHFFCPKDTSSPITRLSRKIQDTWYEQSNMQLSVSIRAERRTLESEGDYTSSLERLSKSSEISIIPLKVCEGTRSLIHANNSESRSSRVLNGITSSFETVTENRFGASGLRSFQMHRTPKCTNSSGLSAVMVDSAYHLPKDAVRCVSGETKSISEEFLLRKSLDATSAVVVLLHADARGSKALKDKAIQFFCENVTLFDQRAKYAELESQNSRLLLEILSQLSKHVAGNKSETVHMSGKVTSDFSNEKLPRGQARLSKWRPYEVQKHRHRSKVFEQRDFEDLKRGHFTFKSSWFPKCLRTSPEVSDPYSAHKWTLKTWWWPSLEPVLNVAFVLGASLGCEVQASLKICLETENANELDVAEAQYLFTSQSPCTTLSLNRRDVKGMLVPLDELKMSVVIESEAHSCCSARVTSRTGKCGKFPKYTIKLNDDLLNLFDAIDPCDAIIKVKGEEISVHRCVLASRSSYFASLFLPNFQKETKSYAEITDFSADTIKDLIAFLYMDWLPEYREESVCQLLRAAYKYEVDGLKRPCIEILKKSKNLSLAFEILVYADFCGNADLKSEFLSFIGQNLGSLQDCWSKCEKMLNGRHHLLTDILVQIAKDSQLC